WGQVVRWAASDYVRFDTDKPVYQHGETGKINLTLQTKDNLASLKGDEDLSARLIRRAEPNRKFPPIPLRGRAGKGLKEGETKFEGELVQLPEGEYVIELAPSLAQKLGGQGRTTFIVSPAE